MNDNVTTLAGIVREDGVKDILPLKTRLEFARALQAEREGRPLEASEHLNLAVDAIDSINAAEVKVRTGSLHAVAVITALS